MHKSSVVTHSIELHTWVRIIKTCERCRIQWGRNQEGFFVAMIREPGYMSWHSYGKVALTKAGSTKMICSVKVVRLMRKTKLLSPVLEIRHRRMARRLPWVDRTRKQVVFGCPNFFLMFKISWCVWPYLGSLSRLTDESLLKSRRDSIYRKRFLLPRR